MSYFKDLEFRQRILALMMRDRKFLRKLSGKLTPQDFAAKPQDGSEGWAIEWVGWQTLQYWKEYRQPIGGLLKTFALDWVRANPKKTSKQDREALLSLIETLKNPELGVAVEAIQDKVLKYKERQFLRSAVEELIEFQEKGQLEAKTFREIAARAMTRIAFDDKITNYSETLEKRIQRRQKDRNEDFPLLFIEQFDQSTRTIPRGQVGLVLAPYKIGKALVHGTKVLTPTGRINIESVKIGDLVIGKEGRGIKVTGVFPQGMRESYRVSFTDDTYVDCDGEHIWTVSKLGGDGKREGWVQMTVNELRKTRHLCGSDICNPHGMGSDYKVPLVAPIQFEKKKLPINPYVLGVILGDGGLTQGGISITSADDEILQCVGARLPDNVRVVRRKYSKYAYCLSAKGGFGPGRNSIKNALVELGLWGKYSYQKYIPQQYLYADIESRRELLCGLLDTDGTASKQNGCVSYSTTSLRLAKDVRFLVHSLGGFSKIVPHVIPNGQRQPYDVYINLDLGMKIFRLKRKAVRLKLRKGKMRVRRIRSISKLGLKPTTCITVDSLDGLFAVNNCVLTHNSAFMAHLARAYAFQGLGTILFTLEDPEFWVEDRLDASLCGISLASLPRESEDLRRQWKLAWEKMRANIFLVDATGGGWTMQRMMEVSDNLRNRGEKIDCILIDYDEQVDVVGKYTGEHSMRMKSNEIWLDAVRWAARDDYWLWMAAQATISKAATNKILSGEDQAEDKGKIRKVGIGLGVGLSPSPAVFNKFGKNARWLQIIAHRFGPSRIGWPIVGDFDCGVFYDGDASRKAQKIYKEEQAAKNKTT